MIVMAKVKAHRVRIRLYEHACDPRRTADGRYLVVLRPRIDRSRRYLIEVVPFPDGPAKRMWPRSCRWVARLAEESRGKALRAQVIQGVGPTIADAVEHWRVQWNTPPHSVSP